MTIPTEPLFIGSRYVQIKFYAAPRNPGDPATIVGTLTLMPDENVLVLDALKGDKGDKGDRGEQGPPGEVANIDMARMEYLLF